MPTSSALTAGILICTRNRPTPLLDCLASVAAQTRPLSQLIIVDSSDAPLSENGEFVAAFQASRFPGATLTYLHTEPGLTKQRNQGLAVAQADVIFMLDDDVVLSRDYVEIIMGVFAAHPEYGGGMGRIAGMTSGRKASDYVRRLFMLSQMGRKGRMLPSGFPTYPHASSDFKEVEVLSGAAMSFRRVVFHDLRFDEAVSGYSYMEDVDFTYRASRQYRLFYEPRAVLEHRVAPGNRGTLAENRRMYVLNHRYFFLKNVYPDCRWCILAYLWAVIGLFVLAILARQPEALRGYWQGVRAAWRPRGLGQP